MAESSSQRGSTLRPSAAPDVPHDVVRAEGADALGSITTISRVIDTPPASAAQSDVSPSKPPDAEAIADDVWRIIRRRLQVERERERGFS
jgi:hypothetical protein